MKSSRKVLLYYLNFSLFFFSALSVMHNLLYALKHNPDTHLFVRCVWGCELMEDISNERLRMKLILTMVGELRLASLVYCI